MCDVGLLHEAVKALGRYLLILQLLPQPSRKQVNVWSASCKHYLRGDPKHMHAILQVD
jgi:hypothetical protein